VCGCSYFNSRNLLTRKVKFLMKIPTKNCSRDSPRLLGVVISPKNRPAARPRKSESIFNDKLYRYLCMDYRAYA
jgi:hypothetical protein